MQKHKQLGARLLSLVLSAAMVTTMLSMTVFAAEGDNIPGGASSIGTIQSFDKLGDRFIPAVGKDAPDHVYGLSVEPNTPVEDLNLPDELGATVATPDATVSSEAVAVTWHSDKEYQPDVNGTFIYTAELTEDYILADGVALPQIYVAVGRQVRTAGLYDCEIDLATVSTSADGYTIGSETLTLTDSSKSYRLYGNGGSNIQTVSTAGDDEYNITLDNVTITSKPTEKAFIMDIGLFTLLDGSANTLNSSGETSTMKVGTMKVQGTGSLSVTAKGADAYFGVDAVSLNLRDGATVTVTSEGNTNWSGGVLVNNAPSLGEGTSLTAVNQITAIKFSNPRTSIPDTAITGAATVDGELSAAAISTDSSDAGRLIRMGQDGTGAIAQKVSIVYGKAAGDTITIEVNGTQHKGATLQAAIEENDIDVADVDTLEITAGKVTTADWEYLENLTAMTSFEIDSAVTNVADIPDARTFPVSIVSVTVPQAISIGGWAFYECTALTTASFPAVTSIKNQAFQGCTALTSISFPKVESLGNFSFKGCTALATLKLGATVPVSVASNAFDGCPELRNLVLVAADGIDLADDALTAAQAEYKADATDGSISDGKWYGWTIVSAPITVTINGTPHEGATLQEAITASGITDAGVTSLEITAGKVTTADWEYLKSLTAMTSFEIAETVTNVADIPDASPSTFPTSIVSVTVPQAISIGDNAFSGCNKLTTATFPAATDIRIYAFGGCSELTDVSFPAVETIENAAFLGCSALESVSFPKVESIQESALGGCTALTTLKLGATPPATIGTDAFKGCPTTRALGYVGADGIDLADDALTAAQAAYTADATDGSTTDGKWYGWTIVSAPITVTINGTPHEGATLQEAITASGITDAGVNTLKITAGKVTIADWEYLENLTALTTFEIARTVTNVADIPTASPSTFPTSIVSVTVPQAISIGDNAFSGCNKLTTATFPAATDIQVYAFGFCSELTDVSLPAVETIEGAAFIGCSKLQTASFLVATEIGINAFKDCTALTSASFPKVESLEIFSFMGCTSLTTLKLGATPPATIGTDAFKGCPTARALGYVGADGIDLADAALTAAQAAYKADATDGSISDNLWYGWAIVPTTGGGGDSTPPAGGSAGGVTTPGKTVIDNPVGNQGSKNTLAEAVKNAIAAGTSNPTVYTNFANYTALTKDGLKAINDATAEAMVGKNVKLSTKVQLDSKVGNVVVSRITVNPVRLATVIPERLGLGVWFDQKQDRQVTSVTNMFEKAFDNKVVTVTFEQKSPLAVSIEFAAKPDLSALNTKNLYFYSYDPVKNIYNRITSPNYWVDKNGYSHITAPFGGSIIITDKPLTKK